MISFLNQTFSQKNRLHIWAIGIFALIFSSISLTNHYLFRTYALDLGIFNNALFDYAHFRLNHYSLQHEFWPNPLADHFSIITFLVSPLYWVFGSYTMLVVQIVAVLAGGEGVRRYVAEKTENHFLPLLAMLHFFVFYGIYAALSFDYHDNVIGTMLLPWILIYFDRSNNRAFIFLAAIFAFSKENMTLWLVAIGLGLALVNWRIPKKRNLAIAVSVISCVLFFMIVSYIMPHLGYPEKIKEGYTHFTYSALGKNFEEAFVGFFTRPFDILKFLFLNHSGNPGFDGIKAETMYFVFLSGGFALLFRPHFFIMLLPIFAQKMYSDDPGKWGICYHYSVEFAPVISLALFNWIADSKNKLNQVGLALLFTALSCIVTVKSFISRRSIWFSPIQVNFYSPNHYRSNLDIHTVYDVLKLIPDEASVSSSSALVPHLAFRKKIFQFPDVEDATYIVILLNEITYPLNADSFYSKVSDYAESPYWETIARDNDIILLKKKT